MKRKIAKWLLISIGMLFTVLFGLFVFFIATAGPTEDHLLRTVGSPDGRFTAKMHQVYDPLVGRGTVEVTLESDRELGTVYRTYFGCADVSAFQLRWDTPTSLVVSYGTCEDDVPENLEPVLQRDDEWKEVVIKYIDGGHFRSRP